MRVGNGCALCACGRQKLGRARRAETLWAALIDKEADEPSGESAIAALGRVVVEVGLRFAPREFAFPVDHVCWCGEPAEGIELVAV